MKETKKEGTKRSRKSNKTLTEKKTEEEIPTSNTNESSNASLRTKEESGAAEIPVETKQDSTVVRENSVKNEPLEDRIEENKPSEDGITENKIPVETVTEAEKVRPVMPEGFCMDEAEWLTNNKCYDKSANACEVSCKADTPEAYSACVARAEFLASPKDKTRTKNKSGVIRAVRTYKSGKEPQSARIDGFLKSQMTLEEMVTKLAIDDFGGDSEAGKKASITRIKSHIKAINTGTYCKSADMLVFTAYLNAPGKAVTESSVA